MTINVVVEIPQGSRNKYEMNKETGKLELDRVLHSSVAYPTDYGFIPNTQSDDGDALDVVLITRFPTLSGSELKARPLGLIEMIDTGESDEKVVAVPEKDPYFSSWKDINDIPEALKNEINEFFSTYKNLEPGKHVEIKGWQGVKEAEEIIKKSMK